jgi:GNAT superfamily N-acetyltransferase
MERTPVWMIRDNVKDIPQHKLPEGYHIRTYQDGDRETWCEIHRAAFVFENSIDKAHEIWDRDFGGHEGELAERMFFVVETATGKAVGTTTSWYDLNWQDYGLDYGRIHWVAVRGDYQGRKLSRPMLTHAMNYIAAHHDRARLATNTDCVRAIGIYLDFGFEPDLRTEKWEEAWAYIAQVGKHPKLERFLKS